MTDSDHTRLLRALLMAVVDFDELPHPGQAGCALLLVAKDAYLRNSAHHAAMINNPPTITVGKATQPITYLPLLEGRYDRGYARFRLAA